MTEWFDLIGKQLDALDVVPENVYNMDETGVLLSLLALLKVLVGKDDMRDYRGAGVKRFCLGWQHRRRQERVTRMTRFSHLKHIRR